MYFKSKYRNSKLQANEYSWKIDHIFLQNESSYAYIIEAFLTFIHNYLNIYRNPTHFM